MATASEFATEPEITIPRRIDVIRALHRKRLVVKGSGTFVGEVLGKHYADGEPLAFDERGQRALSELSGTFAQRVMRLPSEERVVVTRYDAPEEPEAPGEKAS